MTHLIKPLGPLCQSDVAKRLGWSKQKLNGFLTGYRTPTPEQVEEIETAIRELLTLI
jgi:DNA-binding transcriptional regulator YdaS (Cro superfamily)